MPPNPYTSRLRRRMAPAPKMTTEAGMRSIARALSLVITRLASSASPGSERGTDPVAARGALDHLQRQRGRARGTDPLPHGGLLRRRPCSYHL